MPLAIPTQRPRLAPSKPPGSLEPNLFGSLAARLESRCQKRRDRRRRRTNLEQCRLTLSRRGSNRRSVSCRAAPVGCGSASARRRRPTSKTMDAPPQTETRRRADRKAGPVSPKHRRCLAFPRGNQPRRSRLLRRECRPHALSRIPTPTLDRRFRCDRSRLQNGNRLPPQAIRYVLDGQSANAIIALRCSYLNPLFEDYWESRRAA